MNQINISQIIKKIKSSKKFWGNDPEWTRKIVYNSIDNNYRINNPDEWKIETDRQIKIIFNKKAIIKKNLSVESNYNQGELF